MKVKLSLIERIIEDTKKIMEERKKSETNKGPINDSAA